MKLPEARYSSPGDRVPIDLHRAPELVVSASARYANLVGRQYGRGGLRVQIHVGSSGVDPEVIWGKLEALAQGASIASKKFWR